LWKKFDVIGTEMIITKSGRRMFPPLKITLNNLDPDVKYAILLDVIQVDQYRYRYHNSRWSSTLHPISLALFPPNNYTTPSLPWLQGKTYVHPDTPSLGSHWMKRSKQEGSVIFNKVKLTNNFLEETGNIPLQSMHKYIPRIHVYKTFIFQETSFIAVTAYQNERITQLKIDHNPFARGFRD
ncbi:hypothetical protein HELRODRAFT_145007, partial [Helobdella robusta]|uniref:T-box domain-containing protein n=1 Tax=Helobdella robusta TaxID=6412 RepID=T1EJI0_HELRO